LQAYFISEYEIPEVDNPPLNTYKGSSFQNLSEQHQAESNVQFCGYLAKHNVCLSGIPVNNGGKKCAM
jgi:hypothetical protein